jgi:hypothetical protein
MADCKISSILNTIGSQNASDLNPWCAGNYTSDNNYALKNNESCTVSSSAFSNYPKGTVFTCTNGSLTSVVKNQDGTITDAAGNKYKDAGSGTMVLDQPPPALVQKEAGDGTVVLSEAAPPAESNSMTIIIVIVLLLAIGGGAFFFMRKPKVSSMTAFGRKMSKIMRHR